MSFIMLFTCFGTVFAASNIDLTFHITNELDYDEDYIVTVPSGSIITIAFSIENNEGAPFTLSTLQNEIYFDKTFFDYAQGATAEFQETECALKEYSDGEQRVFVNLVENADMSANQLVATFKLKVTETTVGASSVIETKSPLVNGTSMGIAEKNLTVVIGETPADTRRFDITYQDTDGSVLFVDEDILSGQTTHLNNTIAKDGYVLNGWLIDNKAYKPGDSIEVKSDIVAIADWKASAKYTLSFDSKGGSFVQAVSAFAGETVQLTQKPTRIGYSFDGWYTSSNYTGTPITSIVLTDNTTVYAKWSKESTGGGGGGGGATTKYTVSFKTTDGIVLDTIQKASGSTLVLSAYTFAKEGYKFEGWYTDKELTDKVTSVKVDKDITLYAKWIEAPQEQQGANRPAILTDVHHAYIVGRENNLVAPQENITRAEVATIFFRLLTDEIRNDYYSKDNTFADVNSEDWFNTAVSTLTNIGIISGRSDTQFAPNDFITRAEFATIAARFSKGEYDGEAMFSDISGHWAENYINRAASLGWIVGDNGLFRPDDFITRAEAMTLTNRVLGRQPESIDDILTDDMVKFTDNADVNAWYYLAIQEATNSHDYEIKADGKHEKWTALTENPDWSKLEK